MRVSAEISSSEAGCPLTDVQPRTVAGAPSLGGMNSDLFLPFKLRSARQRLAQDLFLVLGLVLVIDVLILAFAALEEIFAARFDPLRRRRHDLDEFGAREAALFLAQVDLSLFAGDHEGNKDGLAAAAVRGNAGEAFASVDHLFNLQSH